MNSLRIFYDGSCGLCHRFVLFTLYRMKSGQEFIFAPLGGNSFQNIIKKNCNALFPDSIIVYEEVLNKIYVKGEAVIRVLESLSWTWRLTASVMKIMPLVVVNIVYDFIAKIRQKLFKKPSTACPILPKEWINFFED